MKKLIFAVCALVAIAAISANAAVSDASRYVAFEGKQIPVIRRADVLVVGSTLDACFLASTFAKEGKSAVLASAGTSLPHELIMCQRPWVNRANLESSDAGINAFLASCVDKEAGEDSLLDMIKVTEGLENLLLDSGASLHYDLFPCGVAQADNRITAVVFACKGGLVAVQANRVIDCTPNALVVTLAGGETEPRASAKKGLLARYSYLCNEERSAPIAVKGVPELESGQIVMHGPFAEFKLRLPVADSHFPEAKYNQEARRIVLEASRGTGLQYARGGNTLLMEPARRIVSRSKTGKLTLDACRPEKLDNVWVCGPMADVDDGLALSMVEPLAGPSFVPLLKDVATKPNGTLDGVLQLGTASKTSTSGTASFDAIEPIYSTGKQITAQAGTLPVVATCDLLVVGAGTSGMPAALVASREGVDTIVVEKFGDVGGTHTIGGVCKYWFGRETDFVGQLDRDADQTMKATGMPKCMGMLDCLMRAGTRMLTHTLAVGAVVDGEKISGVVVTTPNGLGVIQAKCVIDATGDADIVARAGGDFSYGPTRDAMTLWHSFAQYIGVNPEAKRHFAFVVDFRDPTDLSRALVASRRFKKRKFPKGGSPQYYPTPRESRNIEASVRVTYADIMSSRRFEDMISVCRADVDIKGIADSDLSFCGYVTEWMENFSVQIPYRALRPVEFDNVLVVGKAMSVDHDTLSLARMQRDLMAIGGAAGLAAAQSVGNNRPFSEIDINALQKGLIELGVLSAEDLSGTQGVKGSALPEMGTAQVKRIVDELAVKNLKVSDKVSLLMRPDLSVPLLKDALGNATGKGRIEVGKALCFLGDRQGADVLLGELEQSLKTPGLSRETHVKMRHGSPDHASAPEMTYWVNSLGRAGDARVIPLMTEIAKRVEMNPSKSDAMFNYVYSICYAADRLADPECIEALNVLAKKKGIACSLRPIGTDPRETGKGLVSIMEDRYAYLELSIGRAMARCGSKRGYQIVISYLTDIRGFLARSAHEELCTLSNQDFGYDPQAWSRWLEEATVLPIKLVLLEVQ